jgi:PKHD-type hydroxylase
MLLRIPEVLDSAERAALRTSLAAARFEDGMATAGPGTRGVKRNLQLPTDGDAARNCAPAVLAALKRAPLFFSATLPKRIFGPTFNRYNAGMGYGDHLDSALVNASTPVRSDIAVTLFLSSPEEYEGGELVIQDSFGAHRIKLPAGSAIVYPSSSVHRVETVTRGTRFAAVLWVESLVRDESRRRILFDIDLTLGNIAKKEPSGSDVESLTSAYHNLLRMWAET